VLLQTCQDFELIVVDDASSDDSARQVERFSDPRIRLLRRSEPGPGGYAARNLGSGSALAEWISFLDADDTWEETYLQNMRLLQAEFPEAPLLCCGWRTLGQDGQARINPYTLRFREQGPHLIDLARFLECSIRGHSPVCASVVTIRRELLTTIGGFPEGRCRRGGDIDTWLRAMRQSGMAAWHPALGATYHKEAANRVARNTPYDPQGACTFHTVRRFLKEETDPRLRRQLQRFSNHYQSFGLKQRIRSGTLSPADVRTFFAEAEPLRGMMYSLAALLPGGIQRGAARVYERIF
jgi:succinoglycan biosynthesis protein ExoO